MRVVPDDEYPEFIRRLREQARRDTEELVPRPGYPVYGLAEPSLAPVLVAETLRTNGEWTLISLTYGRPEDVPAGPYVTVTTIAIPEDADEPGETGMPTGRYWQEDGHGPEAELRFAVEREQERGERWAGSTEGGGPGPDTFTSAPVVVARETLRNGAALVVRQGNVWAARLETGEPLVALTVAGRGVAPESVRVETLQSLRPLIEGRTEDRISRVERNRGRPRPPLPVPDLPPAHGAAALRALVDFTLATGAEIREATRARRDPRHGRERAGMYNALWQRAVRERQRLAGEDERTANYAVTSAVNHLGHLDSQTAWFRTGERLREAAIDETVRYAMLGDRVPSQRAQYLWARYWSAHLAGPDQAPYPDTNRDPDAMRARFAAREQYDADLMAAWEAWTATV